MGVRACAFGALLGLVGCGAPAEFKEGSGDSSGAPAEDSAGTQAAELTVGSCNVNVEPLRSIEIVHPNIVQDLRASSFQDGAWSFRRMIENMAPSSGASGTDPFLRGIFESWLTDQFVNGERLLNRSGVDFAILQQFQVPNTSPRQFNLANAPFELIGVASRLDLRSTTQAGEGRLIYGLKFPNGGGFNSMTLIMEFALPLVAPLDTPQKWAAKWHELDAIDPATQAVAFASKLQELTDVFTARNAMPSRPNGSAINQIRTNEIALSSPWQLREFRMNAAGQMLPAPTAVSPNHDSINQSSQLRDFINQNRCSTRRTTPASST
jgi:hypothetical protein